MTMVSKKQAYDDAEHGQGELLVQRNHGSVP
jgi:hypothetical protein